jgi:nitrogen fixation-related uncharacterized protein
VAEALSVHCGGEVLTVRIMFRNILIPGIALLMGAIGVFGFFLWDVVHRQFQKPWDPDRAYAGDTLTQRHLASCYMTGCAAVPRDPAFGCAWRTIIADEHEPSIPSDLSAEQKACGRVSPADRKWTQKIEANIRFLISEVQYRQKI